MGKSFILRNFSWKVAAETWDASCFKEGLLEKQQCSQHLRHIAIEKDILSELNRCIFQISLKNIKLVIPKILFMLVVLCSLNFYFKTTWLPPPPNKITPRTKIKISDPRSSKDFFEIFNPPSKLEGGGVHALHVILKLKLWFVMYSNQKVLRFSISKIVLPVLAFKVFEKPCNNDTRFGSGRRSFIKWSRKWQS